jgi:hypothetical protein
MKLSFLENHSLLRVGEVIAVEGRRISVRVDKNKNLSDLFFNGSVIKNISVNSFIEIRKGFLSIIGKVDGEKIQEEPLINKDNNFEKKDRNYRILSISLSGYINEAGKFLGGTKELPLIGNEAFIVTPDKIHKIHNLSTHENEFSIQIASSDQEDIPIDLPIDGLFNSHIAIFGNTGSGKSNTLAVLYQKLIEQLKAKNEQGFKDNCHFLLLDFNGEYTSQWFLNNTKIYNLSTGINQGNKLTLNREDLFDIEIFSILVNATEKTQKPFIKRAIKFYKSVIQEIDANIHIKNILKKQINDLFQIAEKEKAFLIRDYISSIISLILTDEKNDDWADEFEWHNTCSFFYKKTNSKPVPIKDIEELLNPIQTLEKFRLSDSEISNFIVFLYFQLINDIISNRANNEHISPVINRLISRKNDIEKLINITNVGDDLWEESNFITINLHNVNLEMKKMLPLLLAKKVYQEHKNYNNKKTLSFIVDEAHNILSTESVREAETWKDYRLETFNEIIKEGRKFGVFMTISSQRPSDISATIISQAHNYFIHRLINQEDLRIIGKSISYIDKISEESIPSLPVGACIFSGIATQMPLKLNINELPDTSKPKSYTSQFQNIIKT